jgi:hypothetical protein
MVELFVRMWLHYVVKFGNRDIMGGGGGGERKDKNKKYFEVSHL